MLKELVQELNEILGAVETLTAENENMKNEIKVKENRIVELEAQVPEQVDLEELKAIVAELKALVAE